jgi:hypothetical protein
MFITHAKFRSTNSSISSPDRNNMDSHLFAPKYLMWLEEEPFLKYVVAAPTQNKSRGFLFYVPQERPSQLFYYA